jgi:hypothetical protein
VRFTLAISIIQGPGESECRMLRDPGRSADVTMSDEIDGCCSWDRPGRRMTWGVVPGDLPGQDLRRDLSAHRRHQARARWHRYRTRLEALTT